MPGPPPKPAALKLLQGNPGRRKLNENEPKPAVGCAPPAWLPADALIQWRTHAPRLEELGLLTEIDGEAFATLCLLEVELHAAANEDEKNLSHLLYLSKELRGLWARFGVTPADRSRVKTEPKKPASKLGRFIGGGEK